MKRRSAPMAGPSSILACPPSPRSSPRPGFQRLRWPRIPTWTRSSASIGASTSTTTPAGENAEKRRADVVVDHALEWVDRQEGGDFFLFVHFFDPHMNYGAPEPWGGLFTSEIEADFSLPVTGHRALRNNAATLQPARKKFVEAAYDEEVRFVDAQIERFVTALKERGIWEDTLVIFTGDHGEEFFEHGGFEHGHTMYNEVIRVPLVVWGPGIVAQRNSTPVSIADIAPDHSGRTRTGCVRRNDGEIALAAPDAGGRNCRPVYSSWKARCGVRILGPASPGRTR